MTKGLAWADRRTAVILWAVVACAVALRAVLALRCPWEYGYMWDPYYETIWRLHDLHRIPASTDCWECYQPPLFMILGAPLYALGRVLMKPAPFPHDSALLMVEALPLAAGFVGLAFVHRLLRLFRFRGAFVAIGFALAASLPVLFMSSYSLEPDLLLGTLVTAFAYYLTRWYRRPPAASPREVAGIGLLAGLAAATKFSGLVAPVVGTLLLAGEIARPGRRRRATAHLALFLLVAVAIGGWRYADNLRRYGTPFYATASAADGFKLANRPSYWRQYEFATFRLEGLLALTRPDAPPGMLTMMPTYNSVWTTLHGLMWNDLGFFTNPTRHGTATPLYNRAAAAPWLSASVLVLGLLPTLLACAGVVVTLRRRMFRPLALLLAVGMAAYLQWVVAQPFWGLKAKYLLFLLAPWVVYAAVGLRWTRTVLPGWLSGAIVVSIAALVVLSHLYLLMFALG